MKISVGYYLSSVHLLKDNITCAAKRKEQKEKVGKQYIVTAKLILILSLCHAKGQAPRNRFRHPLHLLFNSFRCNRSFKREREREEALNLTCLLVLSDAGACRILQKCHIFGGSDKDLESPSNVETDPMSH